MYHTPPQLSFFTQEIRKVQPRNRAIQSKDFGGDLSSSVKVQSLIQICLKRCSDHIKTTGPYMKFYPSNDSQLELISMTSNLKICCIGALLSKFITIFWAKISRYDKKAYNVRLIWYNYDIQPLILSILRIKLIFSVYFPRNSIKNPRISSPFSAFTLYATKTYKEFSQKSTQFLLLSHANGTSKDLNIITPKNYPTLTP